MLGIGIMVTDSFRSPDDSYIDVIDEADDQYYEEHKQIAYQFSRPYRQSSWHIC